MEIELKMENNNKIRLIGKQQKQVILASGMGYALDAFDTTIIAFCMASLMAGFAFTKVEGGTLTTLSFVGQTFGGLTAGYFADKFGRVRTLISTILWFSLATGLTATSQNLGQLMFWNVIRGIGLGAELCIGFVLMAEYLPTSWRGKGSGLVQSGYAVGFALAGVISALILPLYGWRGMYLVGVAPALAILYIRALIPEPKIWSENKKRVGEVKIIKEMFSHSDVRTAYILICTIIFFLQFAYATIVSWLPFWLGTDRGFSTSTVGFMIALSNVGAVIGFNFSGWLADRYGRKRVYLSGAILAALLAQMYLRVDNSWLLPVLIFYGVTIGLPFGLNGVMLSEHFPTSIRGTAVSSSFAIGRGLGGFCPLIVGILAQKYTLTLALSITSLGFLFCALTVIFLKESSKTDYAHRITDSLSRP